MGTQSGKKVLEKYGRSHFVELGKRGFQVTTDRYFGGDRKAHAEWLRRKGAFTIDRDATYHEPAIYGDPGPHPSESAFWADWLKDLEGKI